MLHSYMRVESKGFVVSAQPLRRTAGDPLAISDMNALVFRWRDEFRVAAIDPWPRVRIRWSGSETLLTPRTMLGLTSPLKFEQRMENALLTLKERAPTKVDLGWVNSPVVEWEPVSALPALPETSAAAGKHGGAYRAGGPRAEEYAVAARGTPSSIEVMLDWLASSPDRSWKDHPRQVRLTEEAIYIERRGGTLFRLPLSTLRHREGPVYDDAVYVFGRRTRLVLGHRAEGCEVRARLDAWLDGERPARLE
ncbi:MAG: hypothetical protein AB8I08_06005 [Sandaracinaceae bacterium]